jgi:hypothetical protein
MDKVGTVLGVPCLGIDVTAGEPESFWQSGRALPCHATFESADCALTSLDTTPYGLTARTAPVV